MSSILSIIDGMKAEVELNLDNLSNGSIFNRMKLFVVQNVESLGIIKLDTLLCKILRPQQGAKMFGTEWRPLLVGWHDY